MPSQSEVPVSPVETKIIWHATLATDELTFVSPLLADTDGDQTLINSTFNGGTIVVAAPNTVPGFKEVRVIFMKGYGFAIMGEDLHLNTPLPGTSIIHPLFTYESSDITRTFPSGLVSWYPEFVNNPIVISPDPSVLATTFTPSGGIPNTWRCNIQTTGWYRIHVNFRINDVISNSFPDPNLAGNALLGTAPIHLHIIDPLNLADSDMNFSGTATHFFNALDQFNLFFSTYQTQDNKPGAYGPFSGRLTIEYLGQ